MAEDTVASEARQAEMQEEINTLQEQYDQILSDNLATERALRKKKFKIESQLASWLSKYDNDVGERQAEYEEISQLYEEELREMTDLQERFDSQEEEYLVLMAEKEEEEQQILDEMVRDYLRHHSARVIQWAWRAYKQRKLARKLARKKKKKGKFLAGFTTPPPPPSVVPESKSEVAASEAEQPIQAADDETKDDD